MKRIAVLDASLLSLGGGLCSLFYSNNFETLRVVGSRRRKDSE